MSMVAESGLILPEANLSSSDAEYQNEATSTQGTLSKPGPTWVGF